MIAASPRNSISGTQSTHIGPETTAELVGGDIPGQRHVVGGRRSNSGQGPGWTRGSYKGRNLGGKEQISPPQGPEPAYTGIVGIAHFSFIEAKASLVKTWLLGHQFPLQSFPPLLRRYSEDRGCGLETPELKTVSKSLFPE